MKRLGQCWNGEVSCIYDTEYPHTVEKLNFLEKLFKEESEQIIIMPGSDGWGYNRMYEFKFISWRNFINILVIVTKDVSLSGNAAQPQKDCIYSEHDCRK